MTTKIATTNIQDTALTTLLGPKVTTIVYPGTETATDTAGGETINLTGNGFQSGCNILVGSTSASVVTFISSTQISFTAPAMSANTYVLYVINPDGGTAISIPGISYSGTPNWTTAAGSLGTTYETGSISTTVTATGDAPITYTLASGTLPTGSTLSSSGSLSGTAPSISGSTQYSFTITAKDAQNQTTNRAFTLTINPDVVTWSTPADNSTTTVYEYTSIANVTMSASSAAGKSITYTANSLPTGLSISGANITGTPTVVANSASLLTGTSATTNKTATRTVNFVVNQDVVTWSSPADNTTTTSYTNSAIANVTMSASSAAGKSITYTANALPTGLSISGANITGTPTITGNSSSLITATASTTNRVATRTFNWVISVANDTYFKNTTLLLNGETTVTPFISDASTNSFGLTINGDTKPVPFNPYQGDGYYSNYFDGSGDYLTIPSNSAFDFGSSNFTIETWVYITVGSGYKFLISRRANGSSYGPFCLGFNGTSPYFAVSSTGSAFNIEITGSSLSLNTWYHIAAVRNGSAYTLYVNGTSVATGTSALSLMASSVVVSIGAHADGSEMFGGGYISNSRIVNGTAVYTSAFTPSTTPLTAITNTSLLTCQSNRLIDKSTNNFTITKNGDVSVSPNIPFTQNSSYSTYGSAYFDGTGDYITYPSNAVAGMNFGSGDFTVEGWIYPIVTPGDGAGIFAGASGTTNPLLLGYRGDASGWGFGRNFVAWDYNFSQAPILNQWQHLAVSRSGTTLRLFFNGVLKTTVTTSQSYSMSGGGTQGWNGTTGYLTGYISDVRATNTALYTSTFTPPTSPLTAVSNTQLLTLQYNGGGNNYGIINNSNFNNVITRFGNATQGTFSPYNQSGWSNYFEGINTSSNIVSGSTTAFNLGTSNFSIEMWFYWNGTYPSGNGYAGLCGSATDYKVALCIWNGSGGSIPKIMYGLSSNGSSWNILQAESSVGSNTVLANQWNHIVLCRNVNTISGFLNGVRDITVTSSASVISRTEGYAVGSWYSTLYYFAGYISNFRFIVGATVPYNATDSTIVVPTTSLTAVTGTQFLTCQSNRFIDNSSNALAVIKNGNTSVQAFNPVNSATSYNPSIHGGSVYLSGTSDYISTTLPAAPRTGSFTMEAWIYPNGTGGSTYKCIFDTSTTGAYAGQVGLSLDSTNKFAYNIGGSSATGIGNVVQNYVWSHVAISYVAGVGGYIYLNGALQGSYTGNPNYDYTSTGFNVGRMGYWGTSYTFGGYISDVRVTLGQALYTSTFTPPVQTLTNYSTSYPAQVLLNFNNGGIIDQHSTNVIETVGNTQLSTSVKKYNNASIYFDGTGDYLSIPSSTNLNFGTGDFTIETWIYPTSISSPASYIFDQRTADSQAVMLAYILSDRTIEVYVSGGVIISGGTVTLTTWSHFAITRASNSLKMFLNGTQIGSTYTLSTSLLTAPMYIGTRYSGTQYFNGYMDDFRVTKGVARYTSNFTAPTSALITK